MESDRSSRVSVGDSWMRRTKPRTGEGCDVEGSDIVGAVEGGISRMQTAAPRRAEGQYVIGESIQWWEYEKID